MSNFITDPATKFDFQPHEFVPFKDKKVCEYVRSLSGKDLEKREDWWHPEFNVKVMMNPHPVLISTLFARLKAASEAGKSFTMILGNPEPDTYIPLAQLINYFGVDCSKVHLVAEDEWADEAGNIAPITYEAGFAHSMIKYLYYQIDEKLRMPMENVHFPTNANIKDYSKIIDDITEGSRFDDGICTANFAIDVHKIAAGDNTDHKKGKKVQAYNIPYRSLVPVDCDNLLLAGRCISGDFYAHASYRVVGNVIPMGEAAGYAAAICVKENKKPSELDGKRVRGYMESKGYLI